MAAGAPGTVAAAMPRLNALAGTLLGALVAWLEVPHPFVVYNTSYALLWGSDLAHGRTPDYSVALAPTPHPLAELAGIALAPLGDGAETAAVVIAYLALGALGYLAYRLGAAWFCAPAGLLAAAILLTRIPVLSFGVRAYVDIPYVALVLAALLAETRRPRAGAPILAIFCGAGAFGWMQLRIGDSRRHAWMGFAALAAVLFAAFAPAQVSRVRS